MTISGHGEKRSRRQEVAIASLLSCDTGTEAAREAHVGEATLRRWLSDVEFQAQYRDARTLVLDRALVRLQHIIGLSIGILVEVMSDRTAPASSRVAAARSALEIGLHARDEDLERRIADLERRLLEGGNDGPGTPRRTP